MQKPANWRVLSEIFLCEVHPAMFRQDSGEPDRCLFGTRRSIELFTQSQLRSVEAYDLLSELVACCAGLFCRCYLRKYVVDHFLWRHGMGNAPATSDLRLSPNGPCRRLASPIFRIRSEASCSTVIYDGRGCKRLQWITFVLCLR